MARTAIALLLLVLAVVAPVQAAQRLVAPGDNWERLAESLRPGDEIVLMPGRHRGAHLRHVAGTGRRPITIRGLTLDRPALIDADQEGIALVAPKYVVIRDLVITGASINGITIAPDPDGDGVPVSVHIRNVTVRETGPNGRRHAIQVVDASNIVIEQCVIEGWGGAAVDLVNCRQVEIRDTRMTALPRHGQQVAVSARGGCQRVLVADCDIVGPCGPAVRLGGTGDTLLTATAAFEAAPEPAGKPAPEAMHCQVLRCRIRDCVVPFELRNARDCMLRNLTIERPRRAVLLIDPDADGTTVPSTGLIFSRSIVTWEPGDLSWMAVAGPKADPMPITFDQNLWWSTETATQRASLGTLPGRTTAEQIQDVEPRLDAEGRPANPRAQLFGRFSP